MELITFIQNIDEDDIIYIFFFQYFLTELKVEKSCNIKITGKSGYLSSPGYPRFYPKVANCTWVIESSKGQEMKLTILDLAMRRGVQSRGKMFCPDSLTILESGHKVKYACGEANDKTRIPVLTSGGEVQIAFRSNEFLPSRGFLLYYKCKIFFFPFRIFPILPSWAYVHRIFVKRRGSRT